MDIKVEGQVWLLQGWVLVTDYRDYSKVLPEVRKLDPLAKVRYVEEDELPAGAERVI